MVKRILQLASVAAACLLLTSCFDSKAPLSDPGTSKIDERLAGVWRLRNDSGSVTYYHVGRVGGSLPASVMRVVGIQHRTGGVMEQFDNLLIFPTAIGGKSFLNVSAGTDKQLELLEKKGWTSETVTEYLFLRYQLTGDTLTVQWIDGEAKKRAIEAGRIKGQIAKDQDGNARAMFTDTSENVATFIAAAGDELLHQEMLKLERVK